MRQVGTVKSFDVPEEQATRRAQQSKPLASRKPDDLTRRIQKQPKFGDPVGLTAKKSDDMLPEFSADEQLSKQRKTSTFRKPDDLTRRVQKQTRIGEPRKSDDMIQEFSADEQLSKQRKPGRLGVRKSTEEPKFMNQAPMKPISSKDSINQPQCKSDENSGDFLEEQKKQAVVSMRRSRARPATPTAKKSEENLSMRKNMRSIKMPSSMESMRKKTNRAGNYGMTLSERAAKKLKSLGSKPIQRKALTAAVEKAKQQQMDSKKSKRPTRAFIAGEDKPQRRKRSGTTSASSSPCCSSPQVPSQSALNHPFVPKTVAAPPPRPSMRPTTTDRSKVQKTRSMAVQNELPNREDKLLPKSEYYEDAKVQKNSNAESLDNVLIEYNGDMVPYWISLPLEEPEDEPDDQIPYNGEAVLLYNAGKLQLEPMPDIQIALSAAQEVKDLENRNLLFFRREIIFGNTVRTMIGLNDMDLEAEPSETQSNDKKVHVAPEPNTQLVYQRGNYKTPAKISTFKPSPPCYGNPKKIADK